MTRVARFSVPVVIQFRALWQPHIHLALLEMDWAILDDGAVRHQADFRYRCDQICFQPEDLVAVRRKPGAAPQCHWVRWAVTDAVRTNRIRLIASLAEMHLPPQGSIPSRQPLAGHLKGPRVVWMEYQNERRQ